MPHGQIDFSAWSPLIDMAHVESGHRLCACDPVGEGTGPEFVNRHLLEPLANAFPLGGARVDLTLSGRFEVAEWIARSGHVLGRFDAPLFGIPPTGHLAHMRFGCFQRLESAKPVETILLLDLPALMVQAGTWPLRAPLGPLLMAPPPARRTNASASASLALVEAMIAGLMRYDGRSLASMNMRDYWSEDFFWFGPAPIGSFQGHADYERGHQGPFLAAFPDRVGGNHCARIAEDDLIASTGWPSIRATHSGGDWLGLSPASKRVEMRVMDFWRAEGGRLVENWVMIDIPHLLKQIGIDLFARNAAPEGE
jgi:predicted ester cyclase